MQCLIVMLTMPVGLAKRFFIISLLNAIRDITIPCSIKTQFRVALVRVSPSPGGDPARLFA